jgi:acyl carrier protein
MGLDSVELLVKVENTFGIEIPGPEAEKILTVGDFHDAVWRHIAGKYSEKCKSQSLFYKLRKSSADEFGFSPENFTLEASPDIIFPKHNRRRAYSSFAKAINLKLPKLELTRPLARLLSLFGLFAILGGLAISIVLINFFDYSKSTLFIPVIGIALTVLLSNLLNPWRTVIEASTIRVFTEHTLSVNYAKLISDEGTNRKEMEMVINHIIAEMAGLNLEEVRPEKRIVADLGID